MRSIENMNKKLICDVKLSEIKPIESLPKCVLKSKKKNKMY